MLFSIVIPTCNRNDLLAKCLDRLAPGMQSLDAASYEVIVTDDSSENDARLLVEENYSWAIWVAGPKRGPAANRNNGARQAASEWLVFTDDDCLPDSSWLSSYLKAIMEFPWCRAFEGAILPDDWQLLRKDMAECPVNDKGGCFWSANVMIGVRLYWQIGGFDEQFKIAAQEDKDIFQRLQNHTPVLFVKESKVSHPVRLVTLREKVSKAKLQSTAWIAFNVKEKKKLWDVLMLAIRNSIKYILSSLYKRHFKALLFHCYCVVFLLPNIPTSYRKIKDASESL